MVPIFNFFIPATVVQPDCFEIVLPIKPQQTCTHVRILNLFIHVNKHFYKFLQM